MSVVERLEEANILWENGKYEGALHSVLTAAAGASRLRYPKGHAMSRKHPGQSMGDHEAFETFLEEQQTLTGTSHLTVGAHGERTFSSVIYTLYRCCLAHEASLVNGGEFVPDRKPGYVFLQLTSLDPLGFRISHSTVMFLADLVARAPEHAEAAASVRAKLMSKMPQWQG